VHEALAPALRPGQVVVLANLMVHKGDRVREPVEERGCELLFLPPYSPDLNPIEEAFAKVKGAVAPVRRAHAEGHDRRRWGGALDAVAARDARGLFGHCGYRSTAQSLCQLL
jgi:hypothetical protein